jgi:TetR/AcrR family transcriptional regulator, mexJK operon transcriptional repressor
MPNKQQAAQPAPTTRSSNRRERALAAGVELFLEHGFDNISMDAIAARAGISKTTLYAHFQDKLGLFRAAFEDRASALDFDLDQTMIDPEAPAEETMTRVVTVILRDTTGDDALAFLRALVTENVRRPELLASVQPQSVPHAIDVVAAALERDAATHGYQLDEPPAHALMFVRMAVAPMQFDALCNAQFRPDEELIARHARWVAEVFLRALRSADSQGRNLAPAPPTDYGYPWMPSQ